MPNDENIYRILTSRAPVVTGAQPSDPEWTDLQQRVGDIEDTPRLLATLADMDPSGAAGLVIIKQEDGTFALGSVADPLSVQPGATADRFGPVTVIDVRNGLRLTQATSNPEIAIIQPLYGTNANTVAEGNHTHALPTVYHTPFSPQGYISSGTRQLQTRNVVLPANTFCLVEAWVDIQIRGGDPGPCYYQLAVTIDGNRRMSPSGDQGFWGVQGVPDKDVWRHERVIAGTGAAITIDTTVSWGAGGGGVYTDAGDLVVRVTPQR